MKILKLGFVFAVAFAVAGVLWSTFTQAPFKEAAPVSLLFTKTAEFPMYVFAIGTFAIGLLIGFFVAAYYYIAGQAGIHSKKKEIRRLQDAVKGMESELEHARSELERFRADTAKAQERITKSMKSVGEKDLFI